MWTIASKKTNHVRFGQHWGRFWRCSGRLRCRIEHRERFWVGRWRQRSTDGNRQLQSFRYRTSYDSQGNIAHINSSCRLSQLWNVAVFRKTKQCKRVHAIRWRGSTVNVGNPHKHSSFSRIYLAIGHAQPVRKCSHAKIHRDQKHVCSSLCRVRVYHNQTKNYYKSCFQRVLYKLVWVRCYNGDIWNDQQEWSALSES